MTLLADLEQPVPRLRSRLPAVRLDWLGTLFLLLTGMGLVAGTALDAERRTIADLVVIIALGLPHGALDPEIARDRMLPRFGRFWFPVFAVPYLALSGIVLLAWHVIPLATLAAFLAMSVWHFGEGNGSSILRITARGGAPVALPVLFHPASTAALLASVAQTPVVQCPTWLVAGSCCWVVVAAFDLCRPQEAQEGSLLPVLALLAVLYACLPPLTALAIYFVCLHSPAHMRDVVADPVRASRVNTMQDAIFRSLPITALTLVIGACLWPLYSGNGPEWLLSLTIQGLAALTLPHMLLDRAIGAGSVQARSTARACGTPRAPSASSP